MVINQFYGKVTLGPVAKKFLTQNVQNDIFFCFVWVPHWAACGPALSHFSSNRMMKDSGQPPLVLVPVSCIQSQEFVWKVCLIMS